MLGEDRSNRLVTAGQGDSLGCWPEPPVPLGCLKFIGQSGGLHGMKTTPGPVEQIPYISRPLPRACSPLPGETIESFLSRLADANVMDREYLRTLAAGDDRKDALPRVPVLPRLSGRPERTLLRALPELTPPGPVSAPGSQVCWSTGPGCRLCNAARGAAKPVRVWHAVEDVLCRRHLRWTAASIGYYSEKQPDLAAVPVNLTHLKARPGYLDASALRPGHLDTRSSGSLAGGAPTLRGMLRPIPPRLAHGREAWTLHKA